ncbi:DMT family transporter [Desulforegula conservatrix]|uniref:DMT family transporter n=1 Tax=Desulforegula conservatrix TaxID=153026 RepID=UPI00040CDAC8|nr:DMT family transporter [Desulforegula conservatrix]
MSLKISKSVVADMSLLFISFVWGATFVMVQDAISVLPPFAFNAVRFFTAFCLFAGLSAFTPGIKDKINKDSIKRGLIIGIWLCCGYSTQTFGLLYTTSSNAGFITGLSVVMVPVFAFFMLRHKIRIQAVIGITCAAAGLYLLTMTGPVSFNKGDLLILFAAASFALHIVFTGKFSPGQSALVLCMIQVAVVSVLNLLCSLMFEDFIGLAGSGAIKNPGVIIAILITACLGTVFAFLTQTRLQKFTTPTRVALIFSTEPVFAAVAGYIWAGERLGIKAVLGCIIILSGMIISELPLKQEHFKVGSWKRKMKN